MDIPSFADPANLVVQPEPEFESESALGLLQAIYKSRWCHFQFGCEPRLKRFHLRTRSSPPLRS
jgi:hypothetical protein